MADLHYRDMAEYAVGHGVAADTHQEDGLCRYVATTWTPRSEVPQVVPELPEKIHDLEIGMDALAEAQDVAADLEPLIEVYGQWIEDQGRKVENAADLQDPDRRKIAEHLLQQAEIARQRMAEGLAALADPDDPDVRLAFQVAGRAMARTARQIHPDRGVPRWRLFQLAFLLMNLRAMSLKGDSAPHDDRDVVDLIFFPTGGGKTEAYLGLAAYTLVLRRLKNPGITSAGLSVLMRYTLRLLTLDQLTRASALICALEIERDHRLPGRHGETATDSPGAMPLVRRGIWQKLVQTGRRERPERRRQAGRSLGTLHQPRL